MMHDAALKRPSTPTRGGSGRRVQIISSGKKGKLVARVKALADGEEDPQLKHLINKPPIWDEQMGANKLDFHGRVTIPSVKNFLLVQPDDHSEILMLFGKIEKSDNIFSLDFRWPLSAIQAFAVGISAVDFKPGCQ